MLVHNLRQAVQTQLVDDLLPLLADFLQDVRFSRGHIWTAFFAIQHSAAREEDEQPYIYFLLESYL
jgi:hypothetical protein